jgi:ADP-ribosyl-[dinitrogen reductase] hydrolase
MSSATLPLILPAVIELVRREGEKLAAEFSRPDGPHSTHADSAPVDHEIELALRAGLTTLLSARFVGEESGIQTAEANGYCWVVDPHDGTRAFLEGRRGSAVSVALLHHGMPVLGVVYAPLSPDRGPDMTAWAEGCDITRNGRVVAIDLSERDLTADDVVFLNHGAWQRPVWNGTACAPARFMPLPSIAYRLARLAVGDGIATVTLRPVAAHDIAAGHALLAAAGGVLLAEDGQPVTYDAHGESRPSACFGGAPKAVAALLPRTWRRSPEPMRPLRVTLTWPRPAEGTRLDRALGCMLGLMIGDSQCAYDRSDSVVARHWDLLAGQPTDAGELALTLARTLAGQPSYPAEEIAAAYTEWYGSAPFHMGAAEAMAFAAGGDATACRAAAIRRVADRDSLAGGVLARIVPIGVWAVSPGEAAAAARTDAALSHPHPICVTACASLAAAIAAALAGADRAGMIAEAQRFAAEEPSVAAALHQAANGTRPELSADSVLGALGTAFHHLSAGTSVEHALRGSAGAVTGALLGAADGRASLPAAWTLRVLTCRPDEGLHPLHPRPPAYWPDDLLDLTEALLVKPAA